jgi:hypothetical protein
VGKVGEDSPLFIVPLDSAENKSNIANFFAKSTSPVKAKKIIEEKAVDKDTGENIDSETHASRKRKLEEMTEELELKDQVKVKILEDEIKGQSPVKTTPRKPTKRAPPSVKKSPVKKGGGTKITHFFGVK